MYVVPGGSLSYIAVNFGTLYACCLPTSRLQEFGLTTVQQVYKLEKKMLPYKTAWQFFRPRYLWLPYVYPRHSQVGKFVNFFFFFYCCFSQGDADRCVLISLLHRCKHLHLRNPRNQSIAIFQGPHPCLNSL